MSSENIVPARRKVASHLEEILGQLERLKVPQVDNVWLATVSD